LTSNVDSFDSSELITDLEVGQITSTVIDPKKKEHGGKYPRKFSLSDSSPLDPYSDSADVGTPSKPVSVHTSSAPKSSSKQESLPTPEPDFSISEGSGIPKAPKLDSEFSLSSSSGNPKSLPKPSDTLSSPSKSSSKQEPPKGKPDFSIYESSDQPKPPSPPQAAVSSLSHSSDKSKHSDHQDDFSPSELITDLAEEELLSASSLAAFLDGDSNSDSLININLSDSDDPIE
jgi:hypothetical protein